MELGLVLQTTPPSARVVDLAKRAEAYGFSHVWTFDSHLLWQEPYVIYSRILAETRNIVVGPMVTNPATRDWTVTASVFATLNEMYGNRTVCGIGRGDSAVRVTNGKPTSIDTLRQSVHVIRELANGREVDYKGSTLRLPWAAASELERVDRRLRPAGAGAGRRGGRRVHPPARRPRHHGLDDQSGPRSGGASGPRPRRRHHLCGGAGLCLRRRHPGHGPTLDHATTSAAGSAGWSATTSPTSSPATASPPPCPTALTDYIKGRTGYDYNEHGQAGNVHTEFVPDDIVDRFCILGPVAEHVRRLDELRQLGVDQFAVYLQHDAKDATLQAYGEQVIPALAEHVRAKA